MPQTNWLPVRGCEPSELVDARMQLHHAALIAAAAGATLLEARADDSHPNLGWEHATRTLAGHDLAGGVRAALQPATLAIVVIGADGVPTRELTLDGRTSSEALTWLAEGLSAAGVTVPPGGLHPPDYDLPDHPVATGRPFIFDRAQSFVELSAWYDNAHRLINTLCAGNQPASEVRCWPHHFDIAALLTVEEAGGVATRTIGVGMTPGDARYPEPYWYVSPWPYPDSARLPVLATGHWHTEDFTAAILTASQMPDIDQGEAQGRIAADFFVEAIAASRAALA